MTVKTLVWDWLLELITEISNPRVSVCQLYRVFIPWYLSLHPAACEKWQDIEIELIEWPFPFLFLFLNGHLAGRADSVVLEISAGLVHVTRKADVLPWQRQGLNERSKASCVGTHCPYIKHYSFLWQHYETSLEKSSAAGTPSPSSRFSPHISCRS